MHLATSANHSLRKGPPESPTIRTSRMLRRKLGQIPYLAINHNPTIFDGVVLGYLLCGELLRLSHCRMEVWEWRGSLGEFIRWIRPGLNKYCQVLPCYLPSNPYGWIQYQDTLIVSPLVGLGPVTPYSTRLKRNGFRHGLIESRFGVSTKNVQ